MYVYQADTYCDSCGVDICTELVHEGLGPADPSDEASFDSDDFPKGPYPEEETDYVDHCASGADCKECIDLLAYGLPTVAFKPVLEGAETQRVGAILSSGLTEAGVSYTLELLTPDTLTYRSPFDGHTTVHERIFTPYQEALHRLWLETFGDEL